MSEPRHPFKYEKPTETQIPVFETLQREAKIFYDVVNALPNSREKSLALTKLEECVMWANKCISFQSK